MQIRRSAEIEQSGFLHMPGSGKTANIASNQWRVVDLKPVDKTLPCLREGGCRISGFDQLSNGDLVYDTGAACIRSMANPYHIPLSR